MLRLCIRLFRVGKAHKALDRLHGYVKGCAFFI